MVAKLAEKPQDDSCDKGKCPFAHLWRANPSLAAPDDEVHQRRANPHLAAPEVEADEDSKTYKILRAPRMPKGVRLFDLVFGKDHHAKEHAEGSACPMPKGVGVGKAVAVAVFATWAFAYMMRNSNIFQ